MKLLSYNLEKHRAVSELDSLAFTTSAGILCLQEARVEELPTKIGNLELMAQTDNNRLGLAIYGDTSRYEVQGSMTKSFKMSIHDRIAAPAHERLIGVKVLDTESGNTSVVASFHASPLTSSNRHRRRQIMEGLSAINDFSPESSVIMAGDYNYPLFRANLSRIFLNSGYDLSFSDTGTYHKSVFRGHFDFVTSKGLQVTSVKTLPRGSSDHKPILVDSTVQRAPISTNLIYLTK